ncbi:MAG: hypothetical protein HY267_07570 [Deltaproteobacteria bacterium]|nr:hypothetical protein [Deltaproteobacteria bacterium]
MMLLSEIVVETHNLFDRYALLIRALPSRERLEKADLLIPEFRLHHDGQLDVYYAPVDYVNETAKVMLLGITPGWTQMEIAYRNVRHDLLDGLSTSEVCQRAKKQASFAGSMRKNLTAMLDGLGVPALLGIPSSESLFSEHRVLLHTSSAIRYPVFVHGRNYAGHSPQILDTPALRWFIDNLLVKELRQVPQAVIIPLGRSVSTVLEYLADKKSIERDRCLLGFPHPSGANGHRVREFEEYRGRLAKQLETQLSCDTIQQS